MTQKKRFGSRQKNLDRRVSRQPFRTNMFEFIILLPIWEELMFRLPTAMIAGGYDTMERIAGEIAVVTSFFIYLLLRGFVWRSIPNVIQSLRFTTWLTGICAIIVSVNGDLTVSVLLMGILFVFFHRRQHERLGEYLVAVFRSYIPLAFITTFPVLMLPGYWGILWAIGIHSAYNGWAYHLKNKAGHFRGHSRS